MARPHLMLVQPVQEAAFRATFVVPYRDENSGVVSCHLFRVKARKEKQSTSSSNSGALRKGNKSASRARPGKQTVLRATAKEEKRTQKDKGAVAMMEKEIDEAAMRRLLDVVGEEDVGEENVKAKPLGEPVEVMLAQLQVRHVRG